MERDEDTMYVNRKQNTQHNILYYIGLLLYSEKRKHSEQ